MMRWMVVMGCRVVEILVEKRGSSIDRGTGVHMYYPLSVCLSFFSSFAYSRWGFLFAGHWLNGGKAVGVMQG
jgi:hypothetical protein